MFLPHEGSFLPYKGTFLSHGGHFCSCGDPAPQEDVTAPWATFLFCGGTFLPFWGHSYLVGGYFCSMGKAPATPGLFYFIEGCFCSIGGHSCPTGVIPASLSEGVMQGGDIPAPSDSFLPHCGMFLLHGGMFPALPG